MTRKVLLAAGGSLVLSSLIWGLAFAAARLVHATDGLDDTDIGAGIIELAIPFLLIPLALTYWLCRIQVRGWSVIGLLGYVVYVVAFFTFDSPDVTGPVKTPLVDIAVFVVYATVATVITGLLPAKRPATQP